MMTLLFAVDVVNFFILGSSAELNLIEWVWKSTRRMAVHSPYFERIEKPAVAVESLFSAWRCPNTMLRTLCKMI